MNLSDLPIKRKLTLVITFTSLVALALTAGAFATYELVSFRRHLLQTAQTIAGITAAQTAAAVDFDDDATAQDILSKLRADPTILQAAVYDSEGDLMAHYPSRLANAAFPAVHPPEARFEPNGLHIFQPVELRGKVIGSLYLKWDLGPAYARIRFYGLLALCVLGGSIIVALFVSNWLQARISKPILDLAETARAISLKRDYLVRAPKLGNDELGELTDAFNHMLIQIHERDAALRENQAQLQRALEAAQQAADAVRALNAELEGRVQERTAELQSANRELEAFTYSVSHDLRSPLRHIDAYAQILEEEHAPKLDDNARKCLQRIRKGVQNMGDLVDDLLNLSRVGRAELQKETVALNPLVDEAIQDLRPETKGRDIEWRIGPLPAVFCDAGLVKQVFANLLSNAVKYTRTRPRALIEVGAAPAGGAQAIFVRDNGVGFNMKYANKLFGVFQRLHRPDEFEGTGVGLATVQRIIHLHGGRIWADAALDKGAAFYFTLASQPPGKETQQ